MEMERKGVHGDAASALDKHEVACLDGYGTVKRVPGSDSGTREGCSLLEGQVVRNLDERLCRVISCNCQ